MTVVIASGVTDVELPRIGWRAQGGDVSASSEVDGFEADRATGQETFDGWQPDGTSGDWTLDAGEAVTVDYCGIGAHDLGTQGATVTIEYREGTSGGYTVAATGNPVDDGALCFLFPPISARFWRVSVTGADEPPTFGHIRFGEVLTVPRRATYTATPIDEGESVTFRTNRSETGEFLGAIVEGNGLGFSVEIDHLSEAFRLQHWRPFKRWAERANSFFIAARPGPYPFEVAYAWLDGRARVTRNIPNEEIAGSVTLDCRGYAKP